MTITIKQAIAKHGALRVYRAIDFEPGVDDRMVALGLPRPQSLLDVWRAQSAAFAALTAAEHHTEQRELNVRLAYLASACKTGRAPRMTALRMTASPVTPPQVRYEVRYAGAEDDELFPASRMVVACASRDEAIQCAQEAARDPANRMVEAWQIGTDGGDPATATGLIWPIGGNPR